ncbi:UPF0149 family protein [Rhodovibrio sodomensis]|nr:UPF0149 family protein [Rhodovibrio sodomensis]
MASKRKSSKGTGGAATGTRRILATLPDAVGAQTVIVVAGSQSKPVLALLLLKIGEGIKDATVVPCHDRDDAAEIIQQHQPLSPQDLPLDLGRTLIVAALSEGAPAPDWPEAARRTGLDKLRRFPIAGRDWLGVLDPDGTILTTATQERADAARTALLAAADWAERHPIVGTWEEDPACLIDAGADPNAHRRELYEYVYPAVERNRPLWREILLRAAVVLREKHDDWFGMALNAAAFDEVTDVRDVPVAHVIAGYTARSFHDTPDGRPADPNDDAGGAAVDLGPPAAPGELERLLAQAGAEADVMWLDGYMTACELAPEPTGYETWVRDLLSGGDVLDDREAAQRLLDLVVQRFETLLEALNDSQAIRDSVADVAGADLAAWARGFTAATRRLPGSWPAERLRETDRAWLDALAGLGRDGTRIAERDGLAAWLAERAEITARPDA